MQVRAVGTGEDAGHRYSSEPAFGAGLSAALDDALSKYGRQPPVRTCFAGLNGEHFGVKAWGVAHMRHHDLFDPALIFEHPADVFGDVGAAMGTLLIALAAETLQSEQRPGPMLVWAASDHAPCGAAFLAISQGD
jgi:3-oxoacyl-[acyl-carrier-protein] synthase I